MRGRHIAVAVVLALAGLVVVAGCGSGGDDASATSGTGGSTSNAASSEGGTKAEFIKQANAACTARAAFIKKKGERVFNEYGQRGEGKIFGKVLVNDVIVPAFEGEISDLRTLEPPAGDAAEIEAILTEIESIVQQVQTDASAKSFYPYKKAEALTAKYGIDACGHP